MWLKSHHWVDVPHSSYERRRELRVRESRHTVMLFDRKYYDCDTGKYDSDRLPTLYHSSLAELVTDECSGQPDSRHLMNRWSDENRWFTPKDDDFDEECEREEEERQRQRQQLLREDEERREKQRIVEQKKRLDEELEASRKRQADYELQLAEVEKRIKQQQYERSKSDNVQSYLNDRYGQRVGYIVKNKWSSG